MKRYLTKRIMILGLILAVFSFSACDDDNGGGNPAPPDSTTEITGAVLNFTTGAGVKDASVSVGNITATTDADGNFTLPDVPVAERTLVMISASDFANQSKIVRLSSDIDSVRLAISLLPVSLTQIVDLTLLQNLIDLVSSAQVTINADNLVGNNGQAPSGNVTGRLTVIDPSGDPDLLPGDYTEVLNGLISVLESYGAIQVNFLDDQGNVFDLFNGALSTIRIPVAQGVTNPPATVFLYFFDEVIGRWVATNQIATLDPTGTFYEGNIPNFASTWSVSQPFSTITVNGCTKDADGNPFSGITVRAQGGDYIGSSTATTNPDGLFSISVKQNARVFLFSENMDGSKSNTIEVNTGTVDMTLADCLAFGQQATSIKLTWGENPRDLDAHLIGDGGLHISFINLGALDVSPFIQLDIDDLVSFGPEIITIARLEEGTYTYSVTNFSATPSMTASPARVELNLEGVVHLFTPPAGEGSNLTWNVFELVVDAAQNITLNRLDTYQPEKL